MKKKLLNTGIIIGFLCIFCLYVQAIEIYTVVADGKMDIKEAVVKAVDSISTEYARNIHKKEAQPIMTEGMTKGEPMVRAVHDVIPYYVSLDEIGEQIEYAYAYAYAYDFNYYDESGYGELGYLPKGEKIKLTIYLIEGNEILFLPEGTGNKTVWLNHELCSLYYSEQLENYLFFYLVNGGGSEELGTPTHTFDSCCGITTCNVVEGRGDRLNGKIGFDSLTKLGEIEVVFDTEKEIEILPIRFDDNEYIDAAINQIQEILADGEIYGEFQLYIGEYGRILTNYYDATDCEMTGCVVGDWVEQYFEFMIHDGEQINGVWLPGGRPPISSESYFLYGLSASSISKICPRIQKIGRGPVSFQVVEGQDYAEQDVQKSEEYDTDHNWEVSFSDMDAEEAGKYLSYVLSYSEWFGMNELGYKMGLLRGLDQKEVMIYLGGDGSFSFVPKEDINTVIEVGEEKEYPLYMNEDGYAELYELSRNPYAILDGQLKLCMVYEIYGDGWLSGESIEKTMAKYGKTVGEATITITDLPALGVPKVEEDEYVLALENYVKDLLEQSGKHGEYRIYIGEYEAGASRNKVCLSAAVSGEGEEYYVRYLIVKSQTGKYYFWSVGFGLNGSLEECAADRHYMNRLCIERTKQLERSEYEIIIP